MVVKSSMARVRARKRRAIGLGGCHSTQGIRAAYSQSTPASTGSVLLRSPNDSAKRRARRGFTTLTSTWRWACKVKARSKAVVAACFQTNPSTPFSSQQVTEEGLMSSGIVAEGLDFLPIHSCRTHCDAQLASADVNPNESLDFSCRLLCHIRPHYLD